jgi:hypothetical protein
MKARLIKKLAECLDGVDLSHHRVGDLLDLQNREAELLIAEGWAIADSSSHPSHPQRAESARECTSSLPRAEAADASTWRAGLLAHLRSVRNQIKNRRFEQHEHRRAEDRIRDELQDSRAKTLRRHHNR